MDATEDAGALTDAALTKYNAVVFLSTTGDVLNDAQQAAFELWVRRDEWYNFRENPRGRVDVLATLDERTYSGGARKAFPSRCFSIIWGKAFSGVQV